MDQSTDTPDAPVIDIRYEDDEADLANGEHRLGFAHWGDLPFTVIRRAAPHDDVVVLRSLDRRYPYEIIADELSGRRPDLRGSVVGLACYEAFLQAEGTTDIEPDGWVEA